ncbi:hypothetical protein DFS34DRAFT_77757 [Phlyctochytrium arcticum]|nr:hypothetical protein DFS34DRAFT_77757 [Phlyctochytrium arcticum]
MPTTHAQIHPSFRKYLSPLLTPSKTTWTLLDGTSVGEDHDRDYTRLKMGLNACGDVRQTYMIAFDTGDPGFPPDIIPAKSTRTEISLSNLPSLMNWDPDNDSALESVLAELSQSYLWDQTTLLSRRGLVQLRADVEDVARTHTGIELCITTQPGDGQSVLVHIPLTHTSTTTDFGAQTVHTMSATLSIQYTYTGTTTLSRVDSSIRFWNDTREYLPKPRPMPKSESLQTYIGTMTSYLKSVHDKILLSTRHRRELVQVAVASLEQNVIEYDAAEWFFATFYFEKREGKNRIRFLVNVHIPPDYPHIPPETILQLLSPLPSSSSPSSVDTPPPPPAPIHVNISYSHPLAVDTVLDTILRGVDATINEYYPT